MPPVAAQPSFSANEPDADLQAHRRPGPSRLPRLPAHRSHDPDARRRQAAHRHPQARRHRHAAPISHSAHSLRRRRNQPRFVLRRPPRTGARRLHLRLRRHSRTLQKRRRIRNEPPPSPTISDPKAIDESTDTYDTVDWLLKNVPGNNGRAGFVGTSYPGFLAMVAGIDPHPAVKAISPQAPMIDVWMGDDFFHNGAFRQTYGYDYVYGMESNKENADVSYGKDKDGKPDDGFDYFLERGSFAEDVKKSGVKQPFPTWKLFLDHPGYDTVWSSRGVEHHLEHRHRANPERRRLLRPGRHVGAAGGVHDARAPRQQARKLPRARPLASRILGFVIASSRQLELRRTHRQGVSLADRGEVLRPLSEGRARLRPRRHRQLPDRLEYLEALRAISAQGSPAHQPAPRRRRPTELERRQGTRQDQLRKRSGQSGSLPPPAHSAHLWRRLAMVQLAHRRPALRHRSQRRRRLEAARAQEGPRS